MGRSHVNRRHRTRPIRWHKRTVGRLLAEVLEARGEFLAAEGRHELIIEVAVWLSNPRALRGIDAPIPAGRHDLIRTWLEWRLDGGGQTFEERARAARRIAPCPDDDIGGGPRRFGDQSSEAVAAAQASLRRRALKRRGGRRTIN
jgi:hypothetical protein